MHGRLGLMGQEPLRSQVLSHIRNALLAGRIQPGEQIRLAPLAEELSISPTPAREALALLEIEGLVVLHPNRGYFAAPMTVVEARSIYPLLGALEALALRFQRGIPPERLEKLEAVNAAMAKAGSSDEALELDRQWHENLVRDCGNDLLLEQLHTLRLRAERYERAYMRHSGQIPSSTEQHQRLTEALREAGDASDLIERHWQLSLDFVERWLAGRPAGSPAAAG